MVTTRKGKHTAPEIIMSGKMLHDRYEQLSNEDITSDVDIPKSLTGTSGKTEQIVKHYTIFPACQSESTRVTDHCCRRLLRCETWTCDGTYREDNNDHKDVMLRHTDD